ncbi:NUDIX hydrolase [Nitrosomonadaceae bacterium]|nr:NUDIX hydrolase [Nitrosomonadaceae bacterium]
MAKNPRSLIEEKLSSQCVYEGDFLHMHQDKVEMSNGTLSVREYVTHPGGVVIIPLLANGDLVLERQHRYPLHQNFYELPAGKIDHNEDPLTSAKRELLEETGYVASEWRCITTLYPCIGYSNEKQMYFLAKGLDLRVACPDDGENIETFTLSFSEAIEWIRTGRITDSKTVSGLFWAEKLIYGNW